MAGAGARRTDGDVVVVSHVTPIKAAVAWALGTTDLYWRLHLRTASVTRIGWSREAPILQERRAALRAAFELGSALPADSLLLHNDLQAAAIELCPEIVSALRRAGEAGAELALVSGSGPTVLGLFARANGLARAERAAAGLHGLEPAPLTATSVAAGFGAVQRVRT